MTNSKAKKEIEEIVINFDYDLVVLGAGPAGQKAALAAAKHGKKVAIIEPRFLGGICTHKGTVPSKTFREAAIHLTNYRLRYMESTFQSRPSMEELVKRVDWVIENDMNSIEHQIRGNGIEIIPGYGYFDKDHFLSITPGKVEGEKKPKKQFQITFDKAVISTGTRPHFRDDVDYDGKHIFCTDNILQMKKLPKSMTIIGGGVIGCEYASIFSVLGVKVTVVEKRSEILALIDREMRANLVSQLDVRKVQFALNDYVLSCEKDDEGHTVTRLASGKILRTEVTMFCTFRIVSTDCLGLKNVGVELNSRCALVVDEDFKTTCNSIYAAGDVVGHPSLASTSFEQGRIAAHRAMGIPCHGMSSSLPIGIYTIPEISYVGRTEEELTAKNIPYSIGKAYYRDTARGSIIGALDGVVKLIFHQDTLEVLAVHIVGEDATELLHVGQAVMELGGTVDYFVEHVFNYPTLAETYKFAAMSGLNRMYDR
jgi:NAD(P) transhydrogenase